MPRDDAHERAIVEAFIRPEIRERYMTLLAHPKRRSSITERLTSIKDFEPSCLVAIAGAEQHAEALFANLRSRGAPATCYVISGDKDLDARELRLEDALAATVGYGSGTLLSCIAGKLGFVEAESTSERYLLVRS
jgi:hypothetical protein